MLKKIILKIIRLYQVAFSPVLPKSCRFWPTCSQYFYLSVEKYGVCKGSLKGIKRILKCYPWHPGGVDLP